MKALFKKLKSKAGESLIESLCAILVFTMASIVMFTMVTTAANINQTAKEMDEQNAIHMIDVEKGESTAKNGTATVFFKLDGTQIVIATENVDIYGGKDGSLYTFFIQTDEVTGG